MTTRINRRSLGGAAFAISALGFLSATAHADEGWHNFDVTGTSPPLDMTMTRVNDGKQVTQADYKGRVVLLYFGYTYCPDVCPTTLTNVTDVLDKLGPLAQRVRVLFVTVDPNRDTSEVLKEYVTAFGPQFDGLRGSSNALADLARRYRIAYSVTSETKDHPYEVTHSSAIYIFDTTGAARLLVPSMGSQTPDIDGTASDLRRLINGEGAPSLVSHFITFLRNLV